MLLLLSADFFKITLLKNYFRSTIRVSNSLGSRSGLMLCRALSGSKLFAKVISIPHKQAKS